MSLFTYGINFHKDYKLALYSNFNEDFIYINEINNRFKLILIYSGSCILKIDENEYAVDSPSVLCINEKSKLFLIKKNGLEAQCIYFHPKVINYSFGFYNILHDLGSFTETELQDLFMLEPFVKDINKPSVIKLLPVAYSKILHLFNEINNGLKTQNDEFWPCKNRSYFIELLYLVRRVFIDANEVDEKNIIYNDNFLNSDKMNEVIIYLHSNYDKKIKIEELSRIFCTNRTTLSDNFKKRIGLSIISYLTKIRIQIACIMLRDTNSTVYEIMDRIGFHDPSHFGRVFKNYTGFSPTQYRKKGS